MTLPEVFEQSFIGRIMIISADDELPPDWRNCDGSRITRVEWPHYFGLMGISTPTVRLPQQYQTQEGMRAVIKLGPPRSV